MVRKCAALLLILGLFSPGMVAALGLGELTIKSYLNEPLRAEVDLLEIGGLNEGQVRIRLASREDFERASVERAYFLTSLNFEVKLKGRDRGTLHISSKLPVREPFLDFLIEVRWPNGRLLREYTVLLDLPVFSGPDSSAVTTSRAPGSSTAQEPSTARARGSDTARTERSQGGRNYGAAAEPEPIAGSEYLVPKNETLWGIASRARPEGSTVPQTMLEIQRLNPQAFINNNINQLKAGYVLRLPTTRDITASDRGAEATVAAQMEDWKGKKSEIDTRLLDEPETSRGDSEQETGKGRLQIAGGEEMESPRLGGGDEDVAVNLEQLDRVSRENDDLQARLNAVEEQLATARRLVELKDDQIATLQTTISSESGEGTGDDVVQGSVGDPEGEGADTDTESATEVTPDSPTPEPVQVTTTTVRPDASDEGIGSYLLYIGLGLLAVLLLLAYLFRDRFTRSRDIEPTATTAAAAVASRAEDDDEFAGVELGDDGLIIDEFSEVGEEHITDEPVELQSISDRDDDVYAAQFESGDALAEADIYIAYGRYPQAVDLLKTAIGIDPRNSEYRVKLLEVCVEMVEREEFQQQYADLQVIGDHNALQKGRDLLDGVDDGEAWLESLPAATLVGEPSLAGSLEPQPAFEDDNVLGEDVSLLDEDFELELDDSLIDEVSDEDAHISIDLEFEEKSSGGEPSYAGVMEDLEGEAPTKIPSIESASYQDPLADLNEFDMENFVPDADELEVVGLSTAELEEIPELELDAFEIEPLGTDDTLLQQTEPGHQSADLAEDLLTEFGELEIEGAEEDEEEAPTELVFAEDGDDISTKLDLARAYMDMGDEDGARSILEEVLQDGSDGQQREATDLLETIS